MPPAAPASRPGPPPCGPALAPDAHPAHSLLSVARSLLFPANTIGLTTTVCNPTELAVLPIEEVNLPEDDVSDLKDVFDAINKLCETMKTSNYSEDDAAFADCSDRLVSSGEVEIGTVEVRHHTFDPRSPESDAIEQIVSDAECVARSQFVSAEDLSILRMETQRQKWKESQASLASSEVSVQRDVLQEERWSDTQTSPPSSEVSTARESYRADRWSDCLVSPPGLTEDFETITSDTEPAVAQYEPTSDLYYTASSEVSLLSDFELAEKQPDRDSDKEEGKECVIAGHVAAMRERFESMTRANTPCPDSMRSSSPNLDVYRSSVTPSPDLLG